ncbi:MAG: acetyl-CoA carboxylase carboxyl transferase subunit alpha, partial [Flavobacteriales bacterium]|nr:acetyl-CoA carboxylase carboxyl transferase subunit alpha [Flavobacteriales bacterium]
MNYLDFEEPIRLLRDQLAQAKELQETSDVDMEALVQDLESKIREVTEKVYSDLTPWQRVQVSRHP